MRLKIKWPWLGTKMPAVIHEEWPWTPEQEQAVNSGEHVEPPWVQFPGSAPEDGTFRRGWGESWLHNDWRPFWLQLADAEREDYIEMWNTPDDWRRALNEYPMYRTAE